MSTEVRQLREAVGTRLLLMPAVVVLPHHESGRLLLVRHADPGDASKAPSTPASAPPMAARRECKEETGLEVELLAELGIAGGAAAH